MLDQVDATTSAIIGVCTAAALLAGAYKVLWHGGRDKHTRRRTPGLLKGLLIDLRGFRDAILGRGPVYDSITRKEIAPALPDLGTRMANQEQSLTVLADAVAKIAESHHRIDDLDARVTALEQQKAERLVGKVEQVQLLRTMETALGATPADDAPRDGLPGT